MGVGFMNVASFWAVLGGCVIIGVSAQATGHARSVVTGITCNAHGAVVTREGEPKLYLGKQCDAAQQGGGAGKWWFAASGFAVEIDGQATLYRLDLDCDVPFCNVDGPPE